MSPSSAVPFDVELPDVSQLVTEDDAPWDNLASEKQQRLLTEPLYASWGGAPAELGGGRRPFLVAANVGLFATVKAPPLVPDVLLSVDVEAPQDPWRKENRSYFLWQFGKPPNVVIEIVSNREGDELGGKRRSYARMGVPHYVVFDPTLQIADRTLTTFELRGDLYVPVEVPRFETLGIGLVEWEGEHEGLGMRWLRWSDLDGVLIPTGAERAGRAEEHARRLRDQLRALGIEPVQ